jgi:hypothetical protein
MLSALKGRSSMKYLALLPILALTLTACSDAPGGIGESELAAPVPTLDELQASNVHNGNPLLGVWRVTSAVQGDGDAVLPAGFSLILTFRPDGRYSLSATNTSDNFVCVEPQTSCTINGTYTYTATTITFIHEAPAPEPGPDTGLYTLCGGKLIYMDFEGEEDGISLTFQRTRRDCYVRDCT